MYTKCCDRDTLFVPLVHPDSDTKVFSTLGKVLSHGYLQCGFLPLKIAFSTLAIMLLGTSVQVASSSFVDSLNTFEQSTLRVGLDSKHNFTPEVQSKLVAIVSRFGGRQLPTTSNLRDIVMQLARYQLIVFMLEYQILRGPFGLINRWLICLCFTHQCLQRQRR